MVVKAAVFTAAAAAGVQLDDAAEFTMPASASKLTSSMTYVKLLLQQEMLGGMVGEQQVRGFLPAARLTAFQIPMQPCFMALVLRV